MGCVNSMDVSTSGEIKVAPHADLGRIEVVKKAKRTVTFEPCQLKSEKKSTKKSTKKPLTPEESLLQAYLTMIRINPTILEQKVEEKRLRDFR